MIKHFCDGCQKELADERYHVDIRVRGFYTYCEDSRRDLCRECLEKCVGKEYVDEMIRKKEEKKQRIAEKKGERE